jgi:hypothetical protein
MASEFKQPLAARRSQKRTLSQLNTKKQPETAVKKCCSILFKQESCLKISTAVVIPKAAVIILQVAAPAAAAAAAAAVAAAAVAAVAVAAAAAAASAADAMAESATAAGATAEAAAAAAAAKATGRGLAGMLTVKKKIVHIVTPKSSPDIRLLQIAHLKSCLFVLKCRSNPRFDCSYKEQKSHEREYC